MWPRGRILADRSRIDHCGELRSAARIGSNPDFQIIPLAEPNDGFPKNHVGGLSLPRIFRFGIEPVDQRGGF